MNVKNEISEELRSLSALVATISRQTPYEAPEGYFTSFPDVMMQRIGGWKKAKSMNFSVPQGYFEGFAQSVLDRIKDASKTGSGPTKQAKDTAESAQAELAPLSPLLAQASRKMPYSVPEGYFDEIAPILSVLRGSNPYSLPAGYFDRLATEIQAKTAETATRPAKVVTFNAPAALRSLASHRLWKYSAAAVIAGLIFAIGWLRLQKDGSGTTIKNSTVNIAQVSDEELKSFLADQDTTLAQPIPSNSTATIDLNDTDLKSMLGDVPDGELKQYMEEHGGVNDIATN
jgi:hypothetical protein